LRIAFGEVPQEGNAAPVLVAKHAQLLRLQRDVDEQQRELVGDGGELSRLIVTVDDQCVRPDVTCQAVDVC
jgi:hypothetical protein